MKYGLDISEVKLPEWWPKGGPSVIPIKHGQVAYEWDVCKSKLPAKFYSELVAQLRLHKPNGVEPPGFNSSKLPKGAKIVTLADHLKGGE